jgi:hypothetical protein
LDPYGDAPYITGAAIAAKPAGAAEPADWETKDVPGQKADNG